MHLRCATFNVLADAYMDHGDYSHVDADLLQPLGRLSYLLSTITDMEADIIGLQEAEEPLLRALEMTNQWQTFWTEKGGGKPDGCLMLVKPTIQVMNFRSIPYDDGTNHVMQTMIVDDVVFINTHIRWDIKYRVGQAMKMLDQVGDKPAVIMADSNDRPGEPVHELIEQAGYTNVWGDAPTALIGSEYASIDLLAVKGVRSQRIGKLHPLDGIPSTQCPSDHIPVMAMIETD